MGFLEELMYDCTMKNKTSFVLKNDLSELAALSERIRLFAEENFISAKDANTINLALEEVIANIISYAYTDNAGHSIKIDIKLDGRDLSVNVTDDGGFFDPSVFPEPRKDIPLEERKPGGMGIHLAKNLVDNMSHERRDGRNILTLEKLLGEK